MFRRAIPVALLVPLLLVAIVVSSSACGTMANFNGGRVMGPPKSEQPPVPFGGVKWDIEAAVDKDFFTSVAVLGLPLWMVELSMSATCDTATLPIVFWINARRAWERTIDERSGPSRVKVTEIEAVPSDSKDSDETKGRDRE